jgi:glycosyltransferase involved in cell wall biosynthesis
VRPGAETPIRVRFIHTRYGHWGKRSGYPSFTQHLDGTRFRTETHTARDDDEEIPRWLRPVQPWLREQLQRRPMKWYKVSDFNAELQAFVRCLAGDLDVVHFLDGEHCGQFLPPLLRRIRSRTRTVVTYHQPPELLEELLDPEVLPLFDHIVLMSPSQRTYFKGRVPEERISVLLHGVDTEFFHPKEASTTNPGRFRCVTVGHWLRDWQVFRTVATQMPDIQFHVVTTGQTGAEHLPNVFQYAGIDDAELAALYRESDVLFLPLQDSTANNALLEGAASGLPVVTTDLPAVRAYLPGAEGAFACVGDANEHLSALRRLRDDPGLRKRTGAMARARAEALNWPKVAGNYEALYTALHTRAGD